jgi:hypothetical protein
MMPKTYNGEKTGSSTNVGEKWLSACRKLKLDPCLLPCTYINSKWIKDLNIKPETLKLVQGRARNKLYALHIGNDFLSGTEIVQQLRERIDKWDYIKLKSFYTTKEMVSKLKRQPTEREKIFVSYTSDKGLITIIKGELKKLNSQKINDPLRKWTNELNRGFSMEEVQMVEKHHPWP